MLQGIIDKNGTLYYYENGMPTEMGLFEYNGGYYFSLYDGKIVTGKYYVWMKHESAKEFANDHYEFGADGKMLDGIINKNGTLYYYENGKPTEMGLFKYNGGYYFSLYDGKIVTGKYYVWMKHESAKEFANDHYEFGADGKMLDGIIDKDGVLYYYENGKPTEKGLFKYNGEYYVAQYDGKIITGKYYVWLKHESAKEFANGHYEFGADGKMLNGIVETNGEAYYYVNGQPTEVGLFIMDGFYYYARYDGMIIRDQVFYVWKTNDLLLAKNYIFDKDGHIIG